MNQAVLQHRERDTGSIVRIPAREIEDLVAARIGRFLKEQGRLIDELGTSLPPRNQQRLLVAARGQAERWPRMTGSEQRTFILRIVAGVTVSEKETRIGVHRRGLGTALLGGLIDMADAQEHQSGASSVSNDIIFTIPARLKLCSHEMRLVVAPGDAGDVRPRPNCTLLKALARAHTWKAKLFSGEAPSIDAIAKAEGVTPRYVGRILRLAFLAPDIVEAILEGAQPPDLELERLMKGVPLSWHAQRRALGFSKG